MKLASSVLCLFILGAERKRWKKKNKETSHLGEIMDLLHGFAKAKGTFLNQVKEKNVFGSFLCSPSCWRNLSAQSSRGKMCKNWSSMCVRALRRQSSQTCSGSRFFEPLHCPQNVLYITINRFLKNDLARQLVHCYRPERHFFQFCFFFSPWIKMSWLNTAETSTIRIVSC